MGAPNVSGRGLAPPCDARGMPNGRGMWVDELIKQDRPAQLWCLVPRWGPRTFRVAVSHRRATPVACPTAGECGWIELIKQDR
eukprot:CAMPEP_0168218792 /NCGR_PEP_ID=MMETSP0140_2-20121125/8138_1 /TAXON_ID=44445 /ORGANISM="Pseudo-nitzschia australis, Strain 10249 10 AB" /LENGTH=82 /DNA_ID=CAMNT_0008146975 /DNA_START=981 /DNA_END=1226 /DNA_ORIENTATION=-